VHGIVGPRRRPAMHPGDRRTESEAAGFGPSASISRCPGSRVRAPRSEVVARATPFNDQRTGAVGCNAGSAAPAGDTLCPSVKQPPSTGRDTAIDQGATPNGAPTYPESLQQVPHIWKRERPNLETADRDSNSLRVRLSLGIEHVECYAKANHEKKVHPGDPGQIPEQQAQEDDNRPQNIGDALRLSHDLHLVP